MYSQHEVDGSKHRQQEQHDTAADADAQRQRAALSGFVAGDLAARLLARPLALVSALWRNHIVNNQATKVHYLHLHYCVYVRNITQKLLRQLQVFFHRWEATFSLSNMVILIYCYLRVYIKNLMSNCVTPGWLVFNEIVHIHTTCG